MAEKERQHTVPKVYLKNFGIQRKQNYYVATYDKTNRSFYDTATGNVAVERNFYRLELAVDPLIVEDFYASQIEPLTGEVIGEIIKRSNLRVLRPDADILNPDLRAKMSICMIYQTGRGRVAKEFMMSTIESILPDVKEKARAFAQTHHIQNAEASINRLLSDENILKFARVQATVAPGRVENISPYLYNRCWILFQIIGDAEFITSDNPVMFVDITSNDATPFSHGLSKMSTAVYYPLSDKLMLALYSYDFASGAINDLDNKIVRLDAAKETSFIEKVNRLQLEQCQKQIFAKSKQTLDQIITR